MVTGWATGRVFVKSFHEKVAELGRPLVGIGQGGRVRLGDFEQHTHGVHVVVGRAHLGQLDERNAQRPDVRLVVVGAVTDILAQHNLGRHPVRRADERVALLVLLLVERRHAKIRC